MNVTGFKTRLHLNNTQEAAFYQWAGARRYAWNFALRHYDIFQEAESLKNEKYKPKLSNLKEINKWFNAGKYPLGFQKKNKSGVLYGTGQHEWARDIPASICQHAIKRDLKESWRRCYNKVSKRPKPAKRHDAPSFCISNIEIKHRDINTITKCINLPKKMGSARLGDLPTWFNESRLLGSTFSEKAGKWYVSFTIELPDEYYYKKSHATNTNAGLDIGIAIWGMDSEGKKYQMPKEDLKAIKQEIERLQRKQASHVIRSAIVIKNNCKVCADKKFDGMNHVRYLCAECRQQIRKPSRTYKKYKKKIAKLNAKLAAIRNNSSHWMTNLLIKRYETIAIEDLKISNMTRSARGDSENPGKRVKQKSGLNREILNISPHKIRAMLSYKSKKRGRIIKIVPPQFTSQTCSECGYRAADNRETQAKFECKSCGFTCNADLNAAKNILTKSNQLE